MSQTQRVSRNNTDVTTDPATRSTVVTLHNTPVVEFNATTITLNSGGWRTSTTRTRMNQVANEYELDFNVFQKAGGWYVTAHGRAPVDFFDGITITR